MPKGYLFQLLDSRLSGGLTQILLADRRNGKSLRKIAKELTDQTGLAVSKTIVHKWVGELQE